MTEAPTPDFFPLRQIRASAGSGKTFELTTSFLRLLADAEDPPYGGCRAALSSRAGAPTAGPTVWPTAWPTAWPDIMAITFTNRAAAEMRERIISRLKDMALGEAIPDKLAEKNWTPALATRRVNAIIRHLSALNVRTIDSLLHLVVRLAALELDLPPDFEPVFANEEALGPLLDSILERTRSGAGQDQRLSALLEEACEHVFFNTSYTGFLAGAQVRSNVLELLPIVMATPAGALARPEEAAASLGRLFGEVCGAGRAMLESLKAEDLKGQSHFLKALAALDAQGKSYAATGRWGKMSTSTMLRKSFLDECLLKESKGKGSQRAEAAHARLAEAVRRMDTDGTILSRALSVLPYVRLAEEMRQELPDFLRSAGAIPADFVPRLARHLLQREQGVSDALCRLGSGLSHILIDEFQDTSREQWQALHPLVVEALAKGGSFTWVGDVKQAIYGWRGGDATLFNEVLHDPELRAVGGEAASHSLPTNWRSGTAIVTTNNGVFSRLAEPNLAKAALAAMLPAETPPPLLAAVLEEGAKLVTRGFAGAGQLVTKGSASGYVRLQKVSGSTAEEVDEKVRTEVLALLASIGARRAWGDVALLVRSNDKAALVANWLLEEGIPVVTENSFLLAEHPLIMQFVCLLRFLDSPDDEPAFLGLVSGSLLAPLTGLEPDTFNSWLAGERGKRGQEKTPAERDPAGRDPAGRGPLYLRFQRDFPEIWETWLKPFHFDAGLLTPYDAVQEALDRFAVERRFPHTSAFVQRFLEVLHLAESQGYGSFSSFLEQWKRNGQNEKAPMPEHLNAVRVMTIHKAKGLQFPVVIVPWHDFSPRPRRPVVKVEVDGLGLLAPRGPAMGIDHYRALADDGREMLDLLYVAWTRPEEELYALLTENTRSRSRFDAVLDVLLGHLAMDQGVYSAGKPSAAQASASLSQTLPQDEDARLALSAPSPANESLGDKNWRPMRWLPRLRIFRASLPDLTLQGKRRGLFVHHCLSCLRPAQGDAAEEARRALAWALRTFPFPVSAPEVETQDIAGLLTWYAGQPEAAQWLRHGTPEQSIVDENGDLFRADLVVDNGQEITVVEYKTGDPQAAHSRQIRKYMDLLTRAGTGNLPVRGALVYLDHRSIQGVDASPRVGA